MDSYHRNLGGQAHAGTRGADNTVNNISPNSTTHVAGAAPGVERSGSMACSQKLPVDTLLGGARARNPSPPRVQTSANQGRVHAHATARMANDRGSPRDQPFRSPQSPVASPTANPNPIAASPTPPSQHINSAGLRPTGTLSQPQMRNFGSAPPMV